MIAKITTGVWDLSQDKVVAQRLFRCFPCYRPEMVGIHHQLNNVCLFVGIMQSTSSGESWEN